MYISTNFFFFIFTFLHIFVSHHIISSRDNLIFILYKYFLYIFFQLLVHIFYYCSTLYSTKYTQGYLLSRQQIDVVFIHLIISVSRGHHRLSKKKNNISNQTKKNCKSLSFLDSHLPPSTLSFDIINPLQEYEYEVVSILFIFF